VAEGPGLLGFGVSDVSFTWPIPPLLFACLPPDRTSADDEHTIM